MSDDSLLRMLFALTIIVGMRLADRLLRKPAPKFTGFDGIEEPK